MKMKGNINLKKFSKYWLY